MHIRVHALAGASSEAISSCVRTLYFLNQLVDGNQLVQTLSQRDAVVTRSGEMRRGRKEEDRSGQGECNQMVTKWQKGIISYSSSPVHQHERMSL
jgi:hypothetical protein